MSLPLKSDRIEPKKLVMVFQPCVSVRSTVHLIFEYSNKVGTIPQLKPKYHGERSRVNWITVQFNCWDGFKFFFEKRLWFSCISTS